MKDKTIEEKRAGVLAELARLCPIMNEKHDGGHFEVVAYQWPKGIHYNLTIFGYGDNVVYAYDIPEYLVETLYVVLGLEARNAVEALEKEKAISNEFMDMYRRANGSSIEAERKRADELIQFAEDGAETWHRKFNDMAAKFNESEARNTALVEALEKIYAASHDPAIEMIAKEALEAHKKGGAGE